MNQTAVTLVRLDNAQPFVQTSQMVTNADDGSVSFQVGTTDTGKPLWVGQTPWLVGQPTTYGMRYPDSEICGAYQRATLSGNTVTFLTRPQDVPCVYLLGIGKAY